LTSPVSVTGHEQTSGNRYRLPGIAREGIAQLSLLETALWPLKGGQRNATTFETTYSFKSGTETRQAKVSVYAPLGLQSIDELMKHGIVQLGQGHTDPSDLFLKRGKGLYVVQFFEGPYFRRPLSERTVTQQRAIKEDPLYEPLRAIGVDEPGIRRLFKQQSRGQIQRWIRVTDAAMHEQPRGFPGFKASPAAFLMDAIQNHLMPPDWIYAHEKDRKRNQWAAERQTQAKDDGQLRQKYQTERVAAFQQYLPTPEGRMHHTNYLPTFLEFYGVVEPHRFHAAAQEAANGKIEREHFQFPDFGVWLLEQQVAS